MSAKHEPLECFVCGRAAAFGVKYGKFACEDCMRVEGITIVRQLDAYEQNALLEIDARVGDIVAEYGSDLAKWTEEQRIELWKLVWMTGGELVRTQIALDSEVA